MRQSPNNELSMVAGVDNSINNMILNQQINSFNKQPSSTASPFTSPNIASPIPIKTIDNKNYYKTADEAGIAAIQAINGTSISLGVEFAGLISYGTNGYSYSKASKGDGDTSTPLFSYFDTDGILIGNYHTHGSWWPSYGMGNEKFSEADRDFSFYAKHNYLGTPSGAIKKWEPGWNYQYNFSTGKKEYF